MPLSSLTTLCSLAVIPKEKVFFTHLGPDLLYPYMLHISALYIFIFLGIYPGYTLMTTDLGTYALAQDEGTSSFLILLPIGLAILITFFLSSSLIKRLSRPIIQPNLKWLLTQNKSIE